MVVPPDRAAVVVAHSVTDMALSIIIPVLNEADTIRDHLSRLQVYRERGHELILVDGGSSDQTVTNATSLVDILSVCERGRARQMNAGAELANNDILVFLHADTSLPEAADELIIGSLRTSGRVWGRFDLRLSGKSGLLRIIERAINWRSRWTGVATGDQALFMTREAFGTVDGYREQPLMEDVEMTKRLRGLSAPVCLSQPVITSSRRWESQGIVKTVLLMWRLRLAYFLGADPVVLSRRYYANRGESQ